MPPSDKSTGDDSASKSSNQAGIGPEDDLLARLAQGELIFEEGDRGSHMYIIESGEVEIVKRAGGNERRVAKLGPGNFFGEMAVLEAMPRSASARCLSNCRLLPIDTPTFQRMLHDYPEITVRILKRLSERLRNYAKEERKAREVAAGVLAGIQRRPELLEPAASVTQLLPTLPSISGPTLLHEQSGTVFPLGAQDEWILGRPDRETGQAPDVDLSPFDGERSLSRRHAILGHHDGTYFLREERHTANGTWVEGRQVVPGQVYDVKDGDLITLGLIELIFRWGEKG